MRWKKTWCRAQGHPGGVEPQTWVLSRGTNGLTVTSFGPKKVTIDLGVKILRMFWIPWFVDFVETRRSKIRGKTCEKKTFPQMFNRFSDLHWLFWWIFCIYISGGQPLKVTCKKVGDQQKLTWCCQRHADVPQQRTGMTGIFWPTKYQDMTDLVLKILWNATLCNFHFSIVEIHQSNVQLLPVDSLPFLVIFLSEKVRASKIFQTWNEPLNMWLVGGFSPPLWKMMEFGPVGMMKFPIYGKS